VRERKKKRKKFGGPRKDDLGNATFRALDLGFSAFPPSSGPRDPEALRSFIEDVAPQVRERVAAGARGDGDPGMTGMEANARTERGRAMFKELLWVHAALAGPGNRREARRRRRNGLPGEAVERRLGSSRRRPPVQLKMNCLRYCRFVHSHHRAEDALLSSPRFREIDPSMEPVVDRLEADHARVSDLLDAVGMRRAS